MEIPSYTPVTFVTKVGAKWFGVAPSPHLGVACLSHFDAGLEWCKVVSA
jgi:hypothetical protein